MGAFMLFAKNISTVIITFVFFFCLVPAQASNTMPPTEISDTGDKPRVPGIAIDGNSEQAPTASSWDTNPRSTGGDAMDWDTGSSDEGPLFIVASPTEITFPQDENNKPLYPGPGKLPSKKALFYSFIDAKGVSLAVVGVFSYLVIKKIKLIAALSALGSSFVYADLKNVKLEELILELERLKSR